MAILTRIARYIARTEVFRSVFKTPFPSTNYSRALTVISSLVLHLHPVKVSRAAIRIPYTMCLGGLSFFLFIVLTVTGVLLMFYYVPSVDRAYQDMKDIEHVVSFGMICRNLHRWSAHAMVVTVIFHMCRVFFTGAYKPPRQFNWVIGMSLLALTLFLSFTGYLLPWDQLAYWAITVGTNMAGNTPIVGASGPFAIVDAQHDVRFVLLGGQTIGQNALLRFYVLHCVALPLVVACLCAWHFWRIRKDGFSRPL